MLMHPHAQKEQPAELVKTLMDQALGVAGTMTVSILILLAICLSVLMLGQ
jgi:hypothetical protein